MNASMSAVTTLIKIATQRYSRKRCGSLDIFKAPGCVWLNQTDSVRPWQDIPHLVSMESSPAPYRIPIELMLVNASQKAKTRPMPNLQAELVNVAGNPFCPTLDFRTYNSQTFLDRSVFESCISASLQGVHTSIQVLQGLSSVAAYFQVHVAIGVQHRKALLNYGSMTSPPASK